VVTLQRGVLGAEHYTFKIFQRSFWHLVAGLNLYARYPAEQGPMPFHLFKYSPTAALLFAPIALPPYLPALFIWSLVGALLMYYALLDLLPTGAAVVALLLVYPDVLAAMQACSSNVIVAALMVLGFIAMERRRQVGAAVVVGIAAAIKLFPLAVLPAALLHPRRRRFAVVCLLVALALLALPLVVVSPAQLARQYEWWYGIERLDAVDLAFGLSAMRLLRNWIGGSWPNWAVQVPATGLLLLPLARRRDQWSDPEFRVRFLASVLAYAVLFNHQAERASFVVGSTGVAIWCVTPPRDVKWRVPRFLLGVLALIGLKTLPLLLVWIAMQGELNHAARDAAADAARSTRDPRSVADDAAMAAD
jgi:hypothetical protein